MSVDIDLAFDEEWYGGSATSAGGTATAGYDVIVSGKGFMLDRNEFHGGYFQQTLVNLLNTQQANSGSDQANIPPEVWRRQVESWHQGAGQDRLDREDSNSYQFHDSEGIDPWTKWGVHLLNAASKVRGFAGAAKTVTVGQDVVVMSGTAGYWYSGASGNEQTFTLANAVVDACSDGTALYVLESDGKIIKYTAYNASTSFAGTAVASFNSAKAFLACSKGYLIQGNNNSLFDITSGTYTTAFFVHPNAGYTWRTACDGFSATYLLGGAGSQWQIWQVGLNTAASTFATPAVAVTLPDGEIAYSIASYLGYVLIGVARGFRAAQIEADGTLTYGRLVGSGRPVRCFEGQDRFVWYGQDGDDPTIASLGRLDLSTFADPLTPAYANDLAAGFPGEVSGVATLGASTGIGRRLFVVDGDGVYVEQDELVPSGWLTTGAATFGTNDSKRGMYAQVFHKKITGGTVQLEVSLDEDSYEDLGSNSGGLSMGNVPLPNQQFQTIEARLTLSREASITFVGPTVTRTEMRALVVPGRATQWQIPLLVEDEIETQYTSEARSVVEDYEYLMDLVTARRPVTLRVGDRVIEGHAVDFTWFPTRTSARERFEQGTYVLTVKEIG